MGKEKNDFVRLCAFVALVLAAFLIFINNILPLLNINVTGPVFAILAFIKDIALLLGIAFAAWSYACRSKGLRITYWISLGIYIAGAILGIF